jgi:hypothetical protein
VENKSKYTNNQTFIAKCVLKDVGVRKVMADRWKMVQKEHPGISYERYKDWSYKVWGVWVKETKKIITRNVKRNLRPQRAGTIMVLNLLIRRIG